MALRTACWILVVLLAATGIAICRAADWPQLRHDPQHSGYSPQRLRAYLPSRPAAFLLELGPLSGREIKEGPRDLVVTENFALVAFWKAGEPAPESGREYKAVVIVKRGAKGK